MSPKQGHAKSKARPILTALNAMKFVITISVLLAFVSAVGLPHPKSDPLYEHRLPAVTATAHALKPQKFQIAPAQAGVTVVEPTPTPTPTPVVCPDTQWVWADDGKCHDKPAQQPEKAQAVAQVAEPNRATPPTGAVDGCGDNEYAHYIYMHESGCRTHNPNSSGCDGIGQACPASKVIGPCGYDYACQNAWFSNYATERYGGWAGAYSFWLQHSWW